MRRSILSSILVLVAVALVYAMLPGSSVLSYNGKGDTEFLIGVFAQPIKSDDHADGMAYWKDLGINTMVDHDNGPQKNVTEKQWDAKARENGLRVIREPSNDIAYDIEAHRTGLLIAWSHPDEDDKKAAIPNNWTDTTLTPFLNRAILMRSQASQIPIFANFMGDQYGARAKQYWYTRATSEGTDFYGYDFYPINRGYPMPLAIVEKADIAQSWTGKYPTVFIEISDQRLPKDGAYKNSSNPFHISKMRGPEPEETRIQMAMAIANGTPGIMFFADSFFPFAYDGSTPAMRTMLKSELQIWKRLTSNSGTEITNIPTGLVGRIREWDGSNKKIIANMTYGPITFEGQTYGSLEYKILTLDNQVIHASGPAGSHIKYSGYYTYTFPGQTEVKLVVNADNTNPNPNGSTGNTNTNTNTNTNNQNQPTPTQNPQAPAGSTGTGGGCFIATAAYGTDMEKEVVSLRSFRDTELETTGLGSLFVKTYYSISPKIADVIGESEILRAITRAILKPTIELVD